MRKRSVSCLLLLWLALSVFAWAKAPDQLSQSERRKLDQFQTPTAVSLRSGAWMRHFESAATDQFPMREQFRHLRAVFSTGLYRQQDSHGIYSYQGYLEALTGPLNSASVKGAAEKLTALRNSYFGASSVYLAIVPDKGYFLPEEAGYPIMDYDALFAQMAALLPFAEPVDLTGTLSLESYFRTDSHWRQEKLSGTAEVLADAMGVTLSGDYDREVVKTDFLGVYAGQSALSVPSEPMYRLHNDVLDRCTVFNQETGATTALWDWDALQGRDPYDFYLSGSASFLVIQNPDGPEGRELIVFRDSFGSSLIPLLCEGYQTVTVVDTRYLQPRLLGELLDFHGQDVLLLYSTGLLNHSATLRA